jgi:hypothetical protein
VRAGEPPVEFVGGHGDARPVQAGRLVGGGLRVDQARGRLQRQAGRCDARDAVAAQDRVGVLVAAAPRVAVVGVDRLAVREPDERRPAQVVKRGEPTREAAHELPAGVGPARLAGERLAPGAGRRGRRELVGLAGADPGGIGHGSSWFRVRGCLERASARARRLSPSWGGRPGATPR